MYRSLFLLLFLISGELIADSLYVKIYPDTLKVYHVNTEDNCASMFDFAINQSNDTLYLTEINTAIDLTTCSCPFNLYINIVGLQSGHYTLCVNRIMEYYDYSSTFGCLSVDIPLSHITSNIAVSGVKGPCYQIEDVEGNGSSIPLSYALFNNYPNPFNPISTIKYDLPEGARVQIKVYNVLGKEVAKLVNEEKPAGRYEVEFNASSLASGIYFYRIQAGSFVDTKKMILLK